MCVFNSEPMWFPIGLLPIPRLLLFQGGAGFLGFLCKPVAFLVGMESKAERMRSSLFHPAYA